MSPEEVELLVNSLGESLKTEEASNGPIYVLLSLIVTVSPFVFRYFKKTFVGSIEKVMQIHVDRMDDMFRIMEMHIDELAHVKKDVKAAEEKHAKLDKKVVANSTWIDTLKEKC